MEIIIQPDADSANEVAARLLSGQLREKSASVLGLATGNTPLGLYRLLARRHHEGTLDFSRASSFNLDEYVGLAADHPASYARFMRENLFSRINLPPGRCRIPDGLAENIPAHCAAYERAILEAGGLDWQLLGLGSDGHIGFNEPGSSLASRTRVKTLTEQTRRDNQRYFPDGESMPHHVITMGLATIMSSRTCVLLAFGRAKAEAVQRTVEGPVTASVPASLLQFHPCAKIILDEDAAGLLERASYYRWTYANRPSWQSGL